MSKWLIGLDIGQSSDHTAFLLAERVMRELQSNILKPEVLIEQRYRLRAIERAKLNTEYLRIVERVRDATVSESLRGDVDVLMDATGQGQVVVELMQKADVQALYPVQFVSGDSVSPPDRNCNRWRVGKLLLMQTLAVTLEQDRIDIPKGLPNAELLTAELRNVLYRKTSSNNFKIEAPPGKHDDLVMALALLVWWGERTNPGGWWASNHEPEYGSAAWGRMKVQKDEERLIAQLHAKQREEDWES